MFPIRDNIPSREFPVVTWGIITLNTLIFLFETSLPPDVLKQLFYLFGIVPARYSRPEWALFFGIPVGNYWPFITNMFLHGSWMHIISNMWTLYLFGDNVEDRMGHLRFFIFYILCGIAASLVHLIFNINSTMPAIGASGAISGVMAAYFILFPTARVVTLIPLFFLPYFIEIPAIVYIGVWFISQLFSGTFSLLSPDDVGGIAWWAHIGGFLMGLFFLFFFKKKHDIYRKYFADEIFFDV
ncbi:MAG: rhomboid family intramembrane serine protease [Nitrospirae bacterium]|nr:MAG: rhomboid family intramembrane serine protease [Nitrospirota bacterium]